MNVRGSGGENMAMSSQPVGGVGNVLCRVSRGGGQAGVVIGMATLVFEWVTRLRTTSRSAQTMSGSATTRGA